MSAKWPEPDEWRLSGPGSRRLRMLVYAHVGLDAYLVLAVGCLIVPRAHGFLGYLLHGVFLGQVLLLSIWAGMVARGERTLLAITYGGMYLGGVIAAIVCAGPAPFNPDVVAMFFISGVGWMMAIGLTAFLLRWIGSPLGVIRQCTGHDKATASMQWTVCQMLAATAAAAVAFALARAVGTVPIIYPIAVVVLGLSLVWAMLGMGSPAWRALVVLVEVVVLGATFGFVTTGGGSSFVVNGLLTFGPACLLVAASLLVIRSCGYRLMPARQIVREPSAIPIPRSTVRGWVP